MLSLGTFIFHTPPLALLSSSLLVHKSRRSEAEPDWDMFERWVEATGTASWVCDGPRREQPSNTVTGGMNVFAVVPSAHKPGDQTSGLLGNH